MPDGKVSPEPDEDQKFQKGGEEDITKGPLTNRSCTDIICLVLLLVAWLAFIIVTVAGAKDGNATKLYAPRDYQGAYCGAAKNWNEGPNLENFKKLSFMMNVSATTDVVMKQLLCSSAAANVLTGGASPLLTTQAARDAYRCNCCLAPCGACRRSLAVGGDLTLANAGSTVSARMAELTNMASATSLFSPSGANGDFVSNLWNEASKYFVQSCVTDCRQDYTTLSSATANRTYAYEPAPDHPLRSVWQLLKTTGPFQATIQNAFTYTALPLSACPYPAKYCVPFPGVTFSDLSASDYCTFKMSNQVVAAVGSTVASTFQSLGSGSFTESATGSFGLWVGDFQKSWDSLILTGLCAFVIGLVFLVLLRFLVGPCVWFAILIVLFCFFFGGGVAYVRSFQCASTSIFDTGKQTASALTVTGQVALSGALSGQQVSEAMTGDGSDYRGVQQRTRSGKACQAWGAGNTHTDADAMAYNSTNYPNAGLVSNYCRNPYKAGDSFKASTIWCFTTDTQTRWEECSPVGVISAQCPDGYAVPSESSRKALEVVAYVLFVLGSLWLLLVCIFCGRIRLAIQINKVAAHFVATTPLILLVPVIQAIVAVAWCVLWALSASYLLSQVPDNYMATGFFSSYAEAYGTADTPGECTKKWPTGGVWKDEVSCTLSNSTACWRCAPPRFVFDARVCYSFFSFLWTNAFMIAFGQCLIAGAVAVWFFTPNKEKGQRSAIRTSLYNIVRYHLGSLAFGSLIIAIVQFIRYTLLYFEKQAEAQKNRVMQIVLRVLQCCVWCFEKCLKFLNKNAYIQIAILGKNFCTSAKKAFFLIIRNAARFATVAVLGTIIHFIGYLFVTAGTVLVGYFILRAMHPDVPPVVPLILYTLMGYLVGSLFMNVFGLAVDTCLQCLIATEEMDTDDEDFVHPSLRSVIPAKA